MYNWNPKLTTSISDKASVCVTHKNLQNTSDVFCNHWDSFSRYFPAKPATTGLPHNRAFRAVNHPSGFSQSERHKWYRAKGPQRSGRHQSLTRERLKHSSGSKAVDWKQALVQIQWWREISAAVKWSKLRSPGRWNQTHIVHSISQHSTKWWSVKKLVRWVVGLWAQRESQGVINFIRCRSSLSATFYQIFLSKTICGRVALPSQLPNSKRSWNVYRIIQGRASSSSFAPVGSSARALLFTWRTSH